MFWLYLEQSTIAYSTQIILVVVVSVYLLSLKNKTVATQALIVFSLSLAVSISLDFIMQIVVQPQFTMLSFYGETLKGFASAVKAMALLHFVYYFPYPSPEQHRERRLTLGASGIILLVVLIITTYLGYIFDDFLIHLTDILILPIILIWAVIIAFRRTVHFSRQSGLKRQSWWQAILNPQGEVAKGCRALAFIFIGFNLDSINFIFFILPVDVSALLSFLGQLGLFFILIVVYFNHASESSTLLLKIIGAALMTTLAVLGVVSWIVGPSLESAYHPPNFITSQQTIRFEPNQQGGYNIKSVPFHFNAGLGINAKIANEFYVLVELPFPFPFYKQTWQNVYVSLEGIATFGDSFAPNDALTSGSQPMIAVFPIDIRETKIKNIFVQKKADQVTITWYQFVTRKSTKPNTFQLILYRNGSFDFVYETIDPSPTYNTIALLDAPYLIGITPGTPATGLEETDFTRFLPVSSKDGRAVVQNFYIDFRRYMHSKMLPFGYAVIGSTLFILFGFPLFFRTSLAKPLQILVQAMKAVNAGDLTVEAPIKSHDEIGFLTASFNDMVKSIKLSVNEREQAALAIRNSEESYRRLVELSPDGIFVHQGGIVSYVNPALARLLKADPADLIGRAVLSFVHPMYHESVKERIRQNQEEGQAVPLVEEKFICLDGTIVCA